ncbi:helix-turn-helix domain-containing protein, partial [Pasteurella multocida]|nr:helix-turn-helix domain-containing protein [Pasteurella multocida]
QVSELFRVTPKTVARWADEGKIGFTSTIGGHRRYHRTEIRMLLHSLHTPGPKTDPSAP